MSLLKSGEKPAIKAGNNPPYDINVIVEIPCGGPNVKYELDKGTGLLEVDRYLSTPMAYPGNYGFVPETLSRDGDPIDVLIADRTRLIPGVVINCRPIGVLVMEDEAGLDEKIVAVPSAVVTCQFNNIIEHTDLPDIDVARIRYFFEHYKDLESNKWVDVKRWDDSAHARQMIVESLELAQMMDLPKLDLCLR
ncbi:MAG: inorganic diphosphatase [Planctomycetota bacterium]